MPPRIVFQQYFKVVASEVFVYVYHPLKIRQFSINEIGRVLLWKKVFELFYLPLKIRQFSINEIGRILFWKKVFELFYAHFSNGCDR